MPGCLLELVGEEVRNDIVRSVCWRRERLSAAASGKRGDCCPLLVRGFHLASGLSMMEAALAAFDSLAKAIADHGRRPLAMHAPLCRCVSSDEMMLACLIAASQAGRTAATTAISRYRVHDPASNQLSAAAEPERGRPRPAALTLADASRLANGCRRGQAAAPRAMMSERRSVA